MLTLSTPQHISTQNYLLAALPAAEIAVVGNDGVVGIALFMGGESTPSRAWVQNAGQSYRLKIEYRRGKITVPDRSRLEARVCECYTVVKQKSDRLLSRNAMLVGQLS